MIYSLTGSILGLSSRPISVPDDIFIAPNCTENDNVIEIPMFIPDATSGGFFARILSILLQNQAVYPSLFATHGSRLPFADALCGLWHKQDESQNKSKNLFR